MESRKFIATTIREYMNENYNIVKKQFNKEIELISDYDDGIYVITARHIVDGEIGRATFSYSKKIGGWYGNDVSVLKKYRRIGIMTSIYDFAEELIGEKLKPSLSLSKNMKNLWYKRQNEALNEGVCPKCGSTYIEVINEKRENTNDYYDNIGDRMA